MLVFVSSTYRDLIPERQAVHAALCAGEASAWGMEFFNSQPDTPLNVCLKEVSQCDAVILIIGFRGGSLIPASTNLTYTGAEIEEAQRLAKPIFAFLKTSGGSWRNDESAGPVHDALETLKQHVLDTCGTVSCFENLDELKFRALASIRKWTEQGRPGARKTFTSRDEYFLPYNEAVASPRLFDFRQALHGRTSEFDSLNTFLGGSSKRVAVIVGRGGIGKTKLLYDWTGQIHEYEISFLRQAATWHRESDKELPSRDVIIIADDAHRAAHLPEMSALVQTLNQSPGRRVKLVLSTRPSGLEAIRSTLSRFFDPMQVSEMPALEKLGADDIRALASEVLGPEYAHLRDWLVGFSEATPLVTVVGGRLIARGKLNSLALGNEAEFRQAVFDRFVDEYSTGLPQSDFPWKKLINLMAALSPSRTSTDQFRTKAEGFLGKPAFEIQQALDELEKHGLLIRREDRLGIAPDTLGDFLLENACVNSRGESTGYADAIHKAFADVDLATLLTNLAELEWRLKQKGSPRRVVSAIWDSIGTEFESGDAARRCDILDALAGAAIFQPDQTMSIARAAMDNRAQPALVLNYWRRTQDDVEDRLPKLLEALAYTSNQIEEAVTRLFSLANKQPHDTQKSAEKALQRLASYQVHKPVVFLLHMADVARSIASANESYQGRFTPLAIADVLLEREIRHEEFGETMFRMGSVELKYSVVEPVRRKALAMLKRSIFGKDPRETGAAVNSYSHVLSHFSPIVGRAVTDREQDWQDSERLEALDVLLGRIRRSDTPVPLLREIKNMLRKHWAKHHSDRFNARLSEVQSAISDSEEVSSFDAFCSTEHELWDGNGDFHQQENRAHQELASAIMRFIHTHPSPEAKLDALVRLAAAATEYGIDTSASAFSFIDNVCRDQAFFDAFSKYVLADPHPRLGFQIRVLLPRLRAATPAEYRRVGLAGATHRQIDVAGGTANGVCVGLHLNSPISEDVPIINALATHADPDIRRLAVMGAAKLGRNPGFLSVGTEIISKVDVDGHRRIADEIVRSFGAQGIPPTQLTQTQIEQILDHFVTVDRVDETEYEVFLRAIGESAPGLLQEFFLRRLRHQNEFARGGGFRYSHWTGDLRRYFKNSVPPPGLADQLRRIRDLLDDPDTPTIWIAELFWVFGDAGGIANQVIGEWLNSGDSSRVEKGRSLAE